MSRSQTPPTTDRVELHASVDPFDRTRVIVRGDASGPDTGLLAAVAGDVLTERRRLVLDLDAVTQVGAAFVVLLNELAATAAVGDREVHLEVSEGHLETLERLPLSRAIRVERSAAPLLRKARPAPPRVAPPTSPGTARREGRGFVTSYGVGRRCAARGCVTTLSRYNESVWCHVHRAGGSWG